MIRREDSYRPPDGDTVLQAVPEVVGLKGVPVGEAHEAPVGPLKIHLKFQVVETNPQLLHLWGGAAGERGCQEVGLLHRQGRRGQCLSPRDGLGEAAPHPV